MLQPVPLAIDDTVHLGITPTRTEVTASMLAVAGTNGIGVVHDVLRLQCAAEQADRITILAAEYSGGREG